MLSTQLVVPLITLILIRRKNLKRKRMRVIAPRAGFGALGGGAGIGNFALERFEEVLPLGCELGVGGIVYFVSHRPDRHDFIAGDGEDIEALNVAFIVEVFVLFAFIIYNPATIGLNGKPVWFYGWICRNRGHARQLHRALLDEFVIRHGRG